MDVIIWVFHGIGIFKFCARFSGFLWDKGSNLCEDKATELWIQGDEFRI